MTELDPATVTVESSAAEWPFEDDVQQWIAAAQEVGIPLEHTGMPTSRVSYRHGTVAFTVLALVNIAGTNWVVVVTDASQPDGNHTVSAQPAELHQLEWFQPLS